MFPAALPPPKKNTGKKAAAENSSLRCFHRLYSSAAKKTKQAFCIHERQAQDLISRDLLPVLRQCHTSKLKDAVCVKISE